jgi:hypothetical protein
LLAALLATGCGETVDVPTSAGGTGGGAPDGGAGVAPAALCEGGISRLFDESGTWELDGMEGVAGGGFVALGIAHQMNATLDLGAGPFTLAGTSMFLAGFDPTGQTLWTKPLGSGVMSPNALATSDGMGNLVLSGDVEGPVDLGDGPLASGEERLTVKLDAQGNVLWSQAFQAVDDSMNLVAAGGAGNVAIAGGFLGSMSLGGETFTSGTGGIPGYVAMLDDAGDVLYARQLGDDTTISDIFGIAIGPAGELAACGTYAGTVTLGATTLTGASPNDYFVAALDPAGGPRWLLPAVGASALGVAFSGEDVLVVGNALPNAASTLGGLTIPESGSRSYVARLDPTGNVLWVKAYAGTQAQGIAVDGAGDVLVVGTYDGPVDFGGATLPAPPSQETYLAKLDTHGNFLCVTTSTDGSAAPRAVTVTPTGYAVSTSRGLAGFAAMPASPP